MSRPDSRWADRTANSLIPILQRILESLDPVRLKDGRRVCNVCGCLLIPDEVCPNCKFNLMKEM